MAEVHYLTDSGVRHMERLVGELESSSATQIGSSKFQEIYVLQQYDQGRTVPMTGLLGRTFRYLIEQGYIAGGEDPSTRQRPSEPPRQERAEQPSKDTEERGVSNVPGLNESLFGNGA